MTDRPEGEKEAQVDVEIALAVVQEIEAQIELRSDVLQEERVDPRQLQMVAVEAALPFANAAPPRILAMAVLASATHDILLEQGKSRITAIESVRHILNRPWTENPHVLDEWLRTRYGLDPSRPQEAWHTAAGQFKKRGEEIVGESFTYEQRVLDSGRSWIDVTRCFFNDFLRARDKPDLVAIFCTIDNLVSDHFLRHPEYSTQFSQVSAMGHGDERCQFHFTRTPPRSDGNPGHPTPERR